MCRAANPAPAPRRQAAPRSRPSALCRSNPRKMSRRREQSEGLAVSHRAAKTNADRAERGDNSRSARRCSRDIGTGRSRRERRESSRRRCLPDVAGSPQPSDITTAGTRIHASSERGPRAAMSTLNLLLASRLLSSGGHRSLSELSMFGIFVGIRKEIDLRLQQVEHRNEQKRQRPEPHVDVGHADRRQNHRRANQQATRNNCAVLGLSGRSSSFGREAAYFQTESNDSQQAMWTAPKMTATATSRSYVPFSFVANGSIVIENANRKFNHTRARLKLRM